MPRVESDYRIPPLHHLPLRTAAGERGLDVAYATAAGEVVHREVRDASSLIWFRDMPGVGDMLRLTERATVTVSCQFTAPVSGRYGFWIGGTGEVALQLNGERVAIFNGEALDGDIMGKLMQAPILALNFRYRPGNP